jgi:hypothetical protein
MEFSCVTHHSNAILLWDIDEVDSVAYWYVTESLNTSALMILMNISKLFERGRTHLSTGP